MKTQTDFLSELMAEATGGDSPEVALHVQVQDPLVMQALQSQAFMMAMFSQQVEVSAMEQFIKSRDATVLADASMKGVIPMAKPPKASITATNLSGIEVNIQVGRRLYDSKGRIWVVDKPCRLPDGQSGEITAIQETSREIEHIVFGSTAFYKIEIPKPQNGQFFSSLSVLGVNDDGQYTAYAQKSSFNNTAPNEKVYHVLTNEFQQIYVQFGIGDVAGYQPVEGEKIVIRIVDTYGEVRAGEVGEDFGFENAFAPQESNVSLKLTSLIAAGLPAMTVSVMRELCKYPALYNNESAVYLGDFDFLIRKNFYTLRFLSVWNEREEERARGASVDNINCLFVSFVPSIDSDSQQTDQTKTDIERLILSADNSYLVRFVEPVTVFIKLEIHIEIARIHDEMAVREQIIAVLLDAYGQDTAQAKKGVSVPKSKDVLALLQKNILALQDVASDIDVIVEKKEDSMPESWRFVDETSIDLSIKVVDSSIGAFGQR
jgi:hypothetical protein